MKIYLKYLLILINTVIVMIKIINYMKKKKNSKR